MGETINLSLIEKHLMRLGIEGDMLDAILRMIAACARPAERRGQQPVLPLTRPQPNDLGTVADDFLRSSLRRKELIGRGADDPAWNVLLAVFADQQRDEPVSVSSACYASGAAPTTALRHIDNLVSQGLMVRTEDRRDGRRTHLSLTPDASDRMAQLIRSFCVAAPTPVELPSRPH